MKIPLPLLMVLAMVLWGGGWPALKILTESVSWEVATFWRFAVMSIAFIPVLWWYKKPLHINSKAFAWAGFGALLNASFMGLSFWGVYVGTAGAGGVIVTTLSPLLTVLIAILFLGLKPSFHHTIGLVIGLFGGLIMVEIWDLHVISNIGNIIFVISALVWALLTLSAQRSHLHLDPIHFTFLLGLIATVLTFFVALPYGIGGVFDQDWRFWSALLYLGVFGQTIASSIYFVGSGQMGSGKASSYMFLVPLCALISSYLFLDEIPSYFLLIGGAVSMSAVYLINKKNRA